MRRSPMPPPKKRLARNTRLERHTSLQPGGPLAKVSARKVAHNSGQWVTSTFKKTRRKSACPPKVRKLIKRRAGDACEVALAGCLGLGTDPSHRKAVGAGGRHGEAEVRHNQAANYLWACRHCHDEIESRPAWAKAPERGYKLRENDFPEIMPVLRRGVLVWLDNQGGIS